MSENELILDLEFATKQLGGNEELLQKMFDKFSEQYSNCAENVKKHVNCQNYPDAKRVIHGVKGVSGNLGFKALQQTCREVEHVLINQEEALFDAQLAQCVDDFERTLLATLASVNTYKTDQKQAKSNDVSPASTSEINEAKRILMASINDFQFISPTELQKLLTKLKSTSIDLASLEKAISDLDYALAKSLLSE